MRAILTADLLPVIIVHALLYARIILVTSCVCDVLKWLVEEQQEENSQQYYIKQKLRTRSTILPVESNNSRGKDEHKMNPGWFA